jgi:MFS family permease
MQKDGPWLMTSPNADKFFYGWYVCGACLVIYLFTNGMTIFVPQNLFPRFMETFSATEGQVSLTTGLMFGFTIFLAPFAGYLIDRFGPLRIIRIGIMILAICFTLYPFTQSIRQLIILHIFLGFGLVLGGLVVNVVLLSNWFVRYRGAVIGLLTSMSSIAGLLLPNLISPLVNDPSYGWRWGFGALTVAFWLLAVIPGFWVLKERPADVGQEPDGAASPPDTPETTTETGQTVPDGVSFQTAIRSRTIYVLAIGSACLWFTFQAINSQIQIFLELEAGLTPQDATRLYSSIFGFSIAGKFLFGAISDRFPKRYVMRVTSLLLLIGSLTIFTIHDGALALTGDTTQLMIFALLFGLGYGGSFTMIQLVCVESFGQRALGKLLGIIIGIDSAGGAIGTILTGQLKTTTGSYLLPFGIVVIVAFIALINVMLIRPVRADPQAEITP